MLRRRVSLLLLEKMFQKIVDYQPICFPVLFDERLLHCLLSIVFIVMFSCDFGNHVRGDFSSFRDAVIHGKNTDEVFLSEKVFTAVRGTLYGGDEVSASFISSFTVWVIFLSPGKVVINSPKAFPRKYLLPRLRALQTIEATCLAISLE